MPTVSCLKSAMRLWRIALTEFSHGNKITARSIMERLAGAADGEESPLLGENRDARYILGIPGIRSIPPAMPGKGITGSKSLKNACGDGARG